MKLGVIDYGGGNLRSLLRAMEFVGAEPHRVTGPGDFEGLTHLAFPGQGSFGDSMRNMEERGLVDPLRAWLQADRPFFGICIGYQLLFDSSEESPGTPGLGIIPGRVVRFPRQVGLKVPHMGWNTVQARDPSDPMWRELGEEPYFYYVHSYYPQPEREEDVAATTDYGGPFPCAVRRGNLFATQFHPEKSQHTGLQLMRNFLESQSAPAVSA
ncbi:imidazole glycerol phosphate synthase subunit HisH [Roseibacillus ishigakijimensis]|uniref:Imidazole glycerol phosphate synthase subunit HisH n=1 Tax=Roseibacillus ishigakijimensis TaxID=454146 RepID=A0A934RN12_9BACT|nr:imidazole glycerol phosphate synthase subunit HisH [Roseibacillus ishigakijimensis]MBK1833813.1 imidazole glycerol phosphate synthase subunit HisH [Roseibacillus ishigakijimensis]